MGVVDEIILQLRGEGVVRVAVEVTVRLEADKFGEFVFVELTVIVGVRIDEVVVAVGFVDDCRSKVDVARGEGDEEGEED